MLLLSQCLNSFADFFLSLLILKNIIQNDEPPIEKIIYNAIIT